MDVLTQGQKDAYDRDGFYMADAVPLMGPAGSISLHHGRIVHGSALDTSPKSRRILFYEMMAADAWPIMESMTKFSDRADCDARMLRDVSRRPRLADVPLPASPIGKTIYDIQKGLHARSFATTEG
ncbi:hypothetical protein [Jannaschia donghaensis]|uniref:Phytanoyl-CoA dioxygenase (PhyH) n=1 Tax=Jannaschia donghaensis TaxID=420998 RepID=A0A0M6YJ34_9RHOB|nr:hypothetical protein [Jannaschia donghaensis]CTQ50368.1 hypothetical protein JDO7802_02391 [Jannaschia donghaensis]